MGPRSISRGIESGKLIVVHTGVYAVGYLRPEAVGRAAAAVLTCGSAAALSHSSAAALWGIRARWELPVEVSVAADRRRPGIRIHRSSTLTGRDVRRHLRIRVTSPARTLLDIAPRLNEHQLARAVNDARLQAHLRPTELGELLERLPHHPGAPALRELAHTGQAPTRSTFEDSFLEFCRRFGLPTPRVNTRVAGFEVDALFACERVIVELDGYEFHHSKASFERDRERDAATLATGRVTVRVTWERLTGARGREARPPRRDPARPARAHA